ncbi:LysR substrate-binding domain-containing protein [Hydrogenophaga sp. BPS33]|uniref:LysR substrate-binding domain-containing protein n=1 Tax=Hydrogenophaga sp. BPS33 TaxID=2651974 RepID=UPI001320503D|nr:LysR substrate-binding domain-containing protein [Hydrogenophaga sp. BPS33]QHE84923.1 LysR family transcriptional regulator [Hydrogenophaga sp. BPS33]
MIKTTRPLNAKQLEAFRAVMLTGSMTGAGRFLSVSQPAITRLIRDLEEDLKLQLFNRDTGHIAPTQEARALYMEVERHYAGTERIREAAFAIREFKSARLKIAANLSLTLACLPKAIERFEKRFPTSMLSVQSGVSAEIIDLVSSGSVDIGFAAIHPGRRDVGSAPLAASQWLCMLPKGHPLEARTEITPADLDGVDFIAVGPSSMSRYELTGLKSSPNISPRIRLETRYSVSAATFVRQGLGVAMVDPLAASMSVGDGVSLRRFAPTVPYVLSVVYPALAKPNKLLDELINAVRTVYEETIQSLPI